MTREHGRDDIPLADMDLGRLPDLWQGVEALWERAREFEEPSKSLVLTARKIDLAQPAGHRVYIEAWRHLQCAMDNHLALRSLIKHFGATPWAPWNLLRPAFEAAFYSVWVLEPEAGRTRRQRALRLEVVDEAERIKFYEELSFVKGADGRAAADSVLKRQLSVGSVYRAEAAALEMTWRIATQSINVRDELGKLKTVTTDVGPDTTALYRATWRSLSGYQHGHGYALMTGSNITVLAKTPGGHTVRTEINDENFQSAAQATAWLMTSAMSLWIRRSTRAD